MQNILKYLRKADEDFQLIEQDDIVAVGVSGGKDSMLLLKALSLYKKFEHKSFTCIAIHLKMGFPNMDSTLLRTYCHTLKIPYYEVEVPIYDILKHYKKDDGSLDCSRCSNLKRGAIVRAAKSLQANKIAFAHHSDDAIETFLLNAIYSGKIASFQPKIYYEDNEICFIRPLIYVYEANIINVVNSENIPVVQSSCPKDTQSKREDVKQLLSHINKLFPTAKRNMRKMLSTENIQLWKPKKRG